MTGRDSDADAPSGSETVDPTAANRAAGSGDSVVDDGENTVDDGQNNSVSDSGNNSVDDGGARRDPGHDRLGRSGHRFVLVLYVALVAVAAAAGLMTGAFVENLRPPRFLFVVPFPATPVGFAAYGGLTVALVLGVPLALVMYVSREIDDAR